MIQLDLHPDDKKLRQFALFAIPGFVLVGLVFWWRTGNVNWPEITAWSLAVATPILFFINKKLALPVYWLLTLIGFIIGSIIGPILMGLIFFGLFLPFALFFKLTGRDKLRRRRSWLEAETYWQDVEKGDAASYLKQF